jgi:hypothetical protein
MNRELQCKEILAIIKVGEDGHVLNMISPSIHNPINVGLRMFHELPFTHHMTPGVEEQKLVEKVESIRAYRTDFYNSPEVIEALNRHKATR